MLRSVYLRMPMPRLRDGEGERGGTRHPPHDSRGFRKQPHGYPTLEKHFRFMEKLKQVRARPRKRYTIEDEMQLLCGERIREVDRVDRRGFDHRMLFVVHVHESER